MRERAAGLITANSNVVHRGNSSSASYAPPIAAAASTNQYVAPGASSNGGQRQQGNLSGVSFGSYGRASYTTSGNVSSGRSRQVLVRAEETRKPVDTLNLDEFLAEADASDLRKISTKKTGKL